MVRRICPTCDQVMCSAHYCKTCGKWVKHPYVRDVTYYLNERHPAEEANCTYHTAEQNRNADAAWERRAMQGGGKTKTTISQGAAGSGTQGGWVQRTMPGAASGTAKDASGNAAGSTSRNTVENLNQGTRGSQSWEQTVAKMATPRRSGKSKFGLIMVIIILVIRLLGSCSALAFEAVHKLVTEIQGEGIDVDLGPFVGDGTEGIGGTALTDAEAIAIGTACTDHTHFPVMGTELSGPMQEILSAHGLMVESSESYSYNEQYDNGTTWFATWDSFDLGTGANDVYQYAEIDYDTATGELHSICVSIGDPEVLAAVTGDVIDLLEETGGITAEENCAQELRENLAIAVRAASGFQIQQGLLMVDGMCYDNNYSVTISRVFPEEN